MQYGEPLPVKPDAYVGICSLGGTMCANDDLPWIPRELDLLRAAHERNIPILGHCLDGQLLARALGGTVGLSPRMEIGITRVERVDNPATRWWLGDLPQALEVMAWHRDSFTLPPGASHLLRNSHCPNQAFALGHSIGMQGHPEATATIVRTWVALYGQDINPDEVSIQAPATILASLSAGLQRCRLLSDQLYRRWLERVLR